MTDLISREEAKSALTNLVPYTIDNTVTDSYANGLGDAYYLICQLPSVQMDTEQKRIETICSIANINNIEDLSDGYHTFRQLYYQRMMLFAAIVKQNKDKAWKSLRHENGELCFGGGWFIVGVDTPEGSYTYHYEDNYYSLFDCAEIERGKHWDGHTEKDVTRLLSLSSPATAKWVVWGGMDIPENHGLHKCSRCGEFAPKRYKMPIVKEYLSDYCPNCGAKMELE